MVDLPPDVHECVKSSFVVEERCSRLEDRVSSLESCVEKLKDGHHAGELRDMELTADINDRLHNITSNITRDLDEFRLFMKSMQDTTRRVQYSIIAVVVTGAATVGFKLLSYAISKGVIQ